MVTADRDPWKQLALVSTPLRGEFQVLESTTAVPGGVVLYAHDTAGNRHMLVPLACKAEFPPDQRSAGVHITPVSLQDDDGTRDFVDLACRKQHLNDVFTQLASEVVAELAAAPDDPLRTCRTVLNRWRELIESERRSVLSTEALAGLYGELCYLKELLRRDSYALDRWTGPAGSQYDFFSGTTALEVKTTTAREGRIVEVNGIDQLEIPEGGTLHLAVVRVNKDDPNGESVPELVEKICNCVADRPGVFQKLAAVGYDTRDTDYYRKISFRCTESRVYRVDDAFPRLVRKCLIDGVLPPGVLRVRYSLDLTGEPPVPVADHELEHLLSALVT